MRRVSSRLRFAPPVQGQVRHPFWSRLQGCATRHLASASASINRSSVGNGRVAAWGVRPLSTPSSSPPDTKLRVVMDMDECMIYSTFDDELDEHDYRQREERKRVGKEDDEQLSKFNIVMSDGEGCTVRKRPYLDEFLQAVKSWDWCEVSAFTAGTRDYASRVLDVLDPDNSIFTGGRFYREHCTNYGNTGYYYLKDIRICLGEDAPPAGATEEDSEAALSRILLVDNNPISFVMQPRNALLVPSWYGEPDDTVLKVLPDIILALRNEPDVRVAMERHPSTAYTQRVVEEYRKRIEDAVNELKKRQSKL